MAVMHFNTFPFVSTTLLTGTSLLSTLFMQASGGVAHRYWAVKPHAVGQLGHYHACAAASIKTQERQEPIFLTSVKGQVNFEKGDSQKY